MKLAVSKPILLEVVTAFFIFLFAYTGFDKLSNRANFEVTLSQSTLIGSWSTLISWAVPLTELFICVMLLWRRTRQAGLFASFFLMTFFTVYIAYLLIQGERLPCHCGGVISQLNWSQHLALNIVLMALAGWAVLNAHHQTTATEPGHPIAHQQTT